MLDKESESRDSRGRVDDPSSSSSPAPPEASGDRAGATKPSQTVHRCLLHSPLSAVVTLALRARLDTCLPDPADFVADEFPATLPNDAGEIQRAGRPWSAIDG